MTWEQYWHGDVWMTEVFLKADKERQKRQNQEAWLQGLYFYDALSCALANAFRKKDTQPAQYPERPYEIFTDENGRTESAKQGREEKEDPELLQARLYMQQMVWAGKNWGGK